MGCTAYKPDGTCAHFKTVVFKCPVQKVARDMFGEIEFCTPVKEKLKL